MNKPVDPYDPHHVILGLVTDLQSTNLQRQKQILDLRENNRSLTTESVEQRRRAERAEAKIRVALSYLDSTKSPKGTLVLVRLALQGEPAGEHLRDTVDDHEEHLRARAAVPLYPNK